MSNSQIESYARQGLSSGKSKSQIVAELRSKGVDVDQLSNSDVISNMKVDSLGSGDSRLRSSNLDRDSINLSYRSSMFNRKPSKIYGQDFFCNPMLSFEPNENVAVPQDYVLGPGDQVIIDVWGENETSFKSKISPDGKIMIPMVGPLHLSGLALHQAEGKIRKALSSKYSLSGKGATSQMSLTLGNLRSIKVNIVGEVKVPGTYRVSSLSTVFNALYRAGGLTELGSVRTIRLSRNGNVISTVDLYKYLLDGDTSCNLPLKEGDVIIVPAYQSVAILNEGVRRPRTYETIRGESLDKLIGYAGGFAAGTYSGDVTVNRKDGNGGKAFSINKDSFGKFAIEDGDVLSFHIWSDSTLFENQVVIEGAVKRPGVYALGGEIATVRQLVEKSGGLLDNAFRARACIVRENKDRTKQSVSVAIGAIADGLVPDVMLMRNDYLYVYDVRTIDKKSDITIVGYVNKPGDYPYEDNMSVEDLILKSGGLMEGYSAVKVDVSRMIVDPYGTNAADTISRVFSINFKDGLPVDGKPAFTLCPGDVVYIRKSPSFENQKMVTISGEVLYPGAYSLQTNEDRLSSIFGRAGGATKYAYIEGASLKRLYNADELEMRETMVNVALSEKDSTNIGKLSKSGYYIVGIDLKKALKNPGSDFDVTLREGDELVIPTLNNTVSVIGEVFYPNSVSYVENKPVLYYIRQAGGFSNEAKRGDVYVVYMNGHVDKGFGAEVTPGCEIMVPARPPKRKMSVAEVLSIGTASATLCTVVLTLFNLIKKY